MKSKIDNFSKEELQKIYDNSSSYIEVLNKIGLSGKGSASRTVLYRKEKELDLDTSKLDENRSIKRKNILSNFNKGKDIDEILKENSGTPTKVVRGKILKNDLIEYKCDICGNKGYWNNIKLSLQLDHINGDSTDNRLENLRFLCPNCHTQTNTYGSKKLKKEHKRCKVCNTILSNSNKSGYCRKHLYVSKNKYKDVELKNNEKLIKERKKYLDDIDTMSFGWVNKVAKDWNVSHTQVKRWIKKNYPELKYYERHRSVI